MDELIFDKTLYFTGKVTITDNSADYEDEKVIDLNVHSAYLLSDTLGSLGTLIKRNVVGGSDDLAHHWAILKTPPAYYCVHFGCNLSGSGKLSGSCSSSSSSSSSNWFNVAKSYIQMRRYTSKRACDDFGVSFTSRVTGSPEISDRYGGTLRHGVCLKDVVGWLNSYDLNYSLAFNNCQDFVRGIFQEYCC